jgi:hypothetical protein
MPRPTKLLGFVLCSALLVPVVQLVGGLQPLQAARSDNRALSGVEGNGSGASDPATRQEPVPLSVTQIPGFFSAGDPVRGGTIQEPWDLDLRNGAGQQLSTMRRQFFLSADGIKGKNHSVHC